MASGLGINGIGSEDYNIQTERDVTIEAVAVTAKKWGWAGLRYDEECEQCHRETVVCNYCGRCKTHCYCSGGQK